MGKAKLRVRPLESSDWSVVERLFGPRGACGGCWCMELRLSRAECEKRPGTRNRRDLKKLIAAGGVHACLAFEDGEAVGWCCLGPREDFTRVEGSRVMRSTEPDGAWVVTCFYIPAKRRGRGIATALLRGAVDLARARGARALEGFPVRTKGGYPSTFAFPGVPRLYERAGFRDVTPEGAGRPVFKRRFRRRGEQGGTRT